MTSLIAKNFHLINFPPLLTITLSCIIGIVFHTMLTPFLVFFLITILLFLYRPAKKILLLKQVGLCLFFMMTGAWLHQKEISHYDNFYAWIDNQKCTVRGTVIDCNETIMHHQKRTVITLALDEVATKKGVLRSNKLMLFYRKSNNHIMVGDNITFYDIICKKPSSLDFQRYQIKEQIVATVFDDSATYDKDYSNAWSLRNWVWSQKKRLFDGIKSKLSPECFRFFSSLFLGNRACIKNELEETNEQFKTWGISHFLARSGLHLVLFIFIWQSIFSVIPLPLLIKQIIMLFMSCIYFVMTWTSAPFTRSFLLFILNKVCFFGKIPFHLLHYLTLVCFLFLLYCPLYIFFLDFQLSFALTFALAWLNQVTIQYTKA